MARALPDQNAAVSWRRKSLVVAAVLGLAVAACSSQPPSPTATTPPAVAPVVAAWLDAGLSCGDPVVGMPENAPQWSCQGQLRGVHVNGEFIGDNAGLMDMTLELPSTTSRQTATAIFADVLAATPAFAARRSALDAWLDAWDGSSGTAMADFTDAHASVMRDATWIDLSVARIPYFSSATGSPPASWSPPCRADQPSRGCGAWPSGGDAPLGNPARSPRSAAAYASSAARPWCVSAAEARAATPSPVFSTRM